jgi:hypothetical protein
MCPAPMSTGKSGRPAPHFTHFPYWPTPALTTDPARVSAHLYAVSVGVAHCEPLSTSHCGQLAELPSRWIGSLGRDQSAGWRTYGPTGTRFPPGRHGSSTRAAGGP